jgi:HlyD family secretion protein
MKLSPAGDTQLVVQIDERNLGAIALGQKAIASADAFSKQTFSADVVYINPGIDLQRASIEVKLRVPDPPVYLRQDMTVSVDIEVARRPGALVAPAADIHGLDSADPWVLRVVGGRARRHPVKVGIVSAGKAEIIDGLRENDVILPMTAAIEDGSRVRARIAAKATAS